MTDREEYDRGHVAGGIDARLATHDRHFAAINGSVDRMGTELAGVKLALQRLADAADADRRTVVSTAQALKEAEDTRRAAGSDRWSPWQKLAVLIGALSALAGIVALIVTKA